jgi:hypothetical protein
MSGLRYIEIDGKRHLWRDILQLRREQKKAMRQAQQPALFELRHDPRPVAERTAAGRYLEPSLFACLDRNTFVSYDTTTTTEPAP